MCTAISMIFTQAIEVGMKLKRFHTENCSVVINILNLDDLEISHDHMPNICIMVGKLNKMIKILFLQALYPCMHMRLSVSVF
jgi:hypothetical protein